LKRPIWLFGLIAGILSAGYEYTFYISDSGDSKIMYLAKISIMVICVIFGLILIRKMLGGTISIGRTLLSGVSIGILRSLIMVAAFLVLYYPDGNFYKPYEQSALVQAEEIVMADEEIDADKKEAAIQEIKQRIVQVLKPKGYIVSTIIEGLVTSFVISILTAAFIATNMMYKDLEPKENG
jgi:hypothetical protein